MEYQLVYKPQHPPKRFQTVKGNTRLSGVAPQQGKKKQTSLKKGFNSIKAL